MLKKARLAARFTCASVNHHLALKYCKDLLQMHSEELALKKRGQLVLHLTLLNMQLKEFSFQTHKLWEESIKSNHTMQFTNVCAGQITGIFAII